MQTIDEMKTEATNHSAIGCIEALREFHISVPGDVSVIGCDDNEMCGFVTPGLTTIRIDERALATRAAREVLRLINRSDGRVERLPGSSIVRNSCRIRR